MSLKLPYCFTGNIFAKKLIRMIRISSFLLILMFCVACNSRNQKPVLSGMLWGGEGNMLLIKPVLDGKNLYDTLFIDNMGEFAWNPDSVQPGLYRLENIFQEGITFFIDAENPQFVDGLYSEFPENLKLPDSNLPEIFYAIENNTKKWNYEIDLIIAKIDSLKDNITSSQMKLFENEYDSIRKAYCEQTLAISDEPIARMFALLQTVGNNPMFDMWEYRNLFFETDATLKSLSHLEEVRIFSKNVARLRNMQLKYDNIEIGGHFPTLIFLNDTLNIAKYKGNPVYIEIRLAETSYINPEIQQYKRQGIEVVIILLDSSEKGIEEALPRIYAGHNCILDSRGENSPVIDKLGIMQYPSNFLLNENGIVAAKNIWGERLEKVVLGMEN